MYNLRVVETLLAARLLAKHLALPDTFFASSVVPNRPTLREVVGAFLHQRYPESAEPFSEKCLEAGLEMFLEAVEVLRGDTVREALGIPVLDNEKETGMKLEEIIQASGMDEANFREVYLSWVDGEPRSRFRFALH